MPIASVDSNDSTAGSNPAMATRNTDDFDAIGLKLINPWDLDVNQT